MTTCNDLSVIKRMNVSVLLQIGHAGYADDGEDIICAGSFRAGN